MSEKVLSVEEFSEMIDRQVEKALKELGMMKPERKDVVAVMAGEEAKPSGRSGPSGVQKFFRAAILGDAGNDPRVTKALSEATDSAGGYLVPDDFRAEVVRRLPEGSELYPFVTVIPTKRDAGKIPKLSTDVAMSWDDTENAAFADSDPAFGQLSYTIHRMNAICRTSRELLEDSAVDLAGLLTQLFTEAVAAERDKVIAIGDGSTQPQGIYSASITQSVTVGTLSYAKLVDIEQSLKKKYRRRARWVMSNTNVGRIKKLVDDNGQPVFHRDPTAGFAATILGYPVSQQDDLPDHTILFGDLSYYYLFDRQQLGIETTTVGGDAFVKHQFYIKVWERLDGKLALEEAFAKGTGITG